MKLTLPALLLAASVGLAAHANVTSTFTQSYPLAATGEVRVENVNGSVEITAWDKNEVSLVAEKIAPNQEELDRIDIKIDANADRFAVKTERKKKGMFDNNWRGEVKYRLQVPVHARLEKITVVNASVLVRNVEGTVSLETVNGEAKTQGLTAKGRFKTVNGSLDIGYAQIAGVGEIGIESVNGSCRLRLPANPNFSVEGHTVNGDVRCDFPLTIEKSGHGHFVAHAGAGGPHINFHAVNGDLKVLTK